MSGAGPPARIPAGLVCPRCAASPLLQQDEAALCAGCATAFPVLGGLLCALPDPSLFRMLVGAGLEEYLTLTERRLAEIERERDVADALPLTRDRLGRIVHALGEERSRIRALLAPLVPAASALPPSAIPSRPVPSDELSILKCYEHLFRDWAWGGAESEASRELVERVSPGSLGRLAVFGAGAARLAADVHQSLGPTETFALDVNPLPLLVAEQLVRGASLSLFEFPIGPGSREEVAVEQRLSCPYVVREGFCVLLADALRPPFGPGSLDSVLTPWFVDAAGDDLRVTVAAIGRVLRLGGTWLNLGPLRFDGPVARQYVIEEVLEIVGAAGFEVLAQAREKIPYFDSPVSGSRRVETVFCFAARKTRESAVTAPSLPDRSWIDDPRRPVPLTPELVQLRRMAVFTNALISMVDGKRSIADIAAELGRAWRVDPRGVEDRLRVFLSRLPRGGA